MVTGLTAQQKVAEFKEQAHDVVAHPALDGDNKWARFYEIGPISHGFHNASDMASTAADPGARGTGTRETTEEKEEKRERKERALAVAMDSVPQITQSYMMTQNAALSFIDQKVGVLNEELSAAVAEATRLGFRNRDIAVQIRDLQVSKATVEAQIESTEASLAEVAKAGAEAAAAATSGQEELAADAEARSTGLRDDQGRLIIVDEIEGDRRGDKYQIYSVLDEETHTITPLYELPKEERDAIRAAIREAETNGAKIYSASEILSPEDRAKLKSGVTAAFSEFRAMRERGLFLRTELGELRTELDRINEEITTLSTEAEANAERLTVLNAEIEEKKGQIADYESLAEGIREGKYKTAAEIDAAMEEKFGEEWSTYNQEWQSYYNNAQNREMTQFITGQQCDTARALKGVNNSIKMLGQEGFADDSPEIMALQEQRSALKADLAQDRQTISMIMSNDHSQDELAAVMIERYGPEWTSWQQEQMQAEAQAVTAAAEPVSAASAALGVPPGTGAAAASFNMASGKDPAAAPAPGAPEQAPEAFAAAEMARKNATMGMNASA